MREPELKPRSVLCESSLLVLFIIIVVVIIIIFLGTCPSDMEVPRLGVESEL